MKVALFLASLAALAVLIGRCLAFGSMADRTMVEQRRDALLKADEEQRRRLAGWERR